MTELKIAIIGADIGLNHLKSLSRIQTEAGLEPRVIGIAKHSSDIGRMVQKASREGLNINDVRDLLYVGEQRTAELLNDQRVEAVIVATPDELHYRFAAYALNSGKHVMVEKPLTTTRENGYDLIRAAIAEGVVLATGTQNGWHREDIERIINANDVARIDYVYKLPLIAGKNEDHHPIDNILPHPLSALPGEIEVMRVDNYGKIYVVRAIAGDKKRVPVNIRIGYSDGVSDSPVRVFIFSTEQVSNTRYMLRKHESNRIVDGVYHEVWNSNGEEMVVRDPRERMLRDFIRGIAGDAAYRQETYSRVENEHKALMRAKELAGLRV